MTVKYNPAPGWPAPPDGWTPPEGWEPPADWPPAPAGWQYVVEEKPAGPTYGTPPEPEPAPATPKPRHSAPRPEARDPARSPAADPPASGTPASGTPAAGLAWPDAPWPPTTNTEARRSRRKQVRWVVMGAAAIVLLTGLIWPRGDADPGAAPVVDDLATTSAFDLPTPEPGQAPVTRSVGTPVARADGTTGPPPLVYSGTGSAVFDVEKPASGPAFVNIEQIGDYGMVAAYDKSEGFSSYGASPDTGSASFLIDVSPWYSETTLETDLVQVYALGAWTIEIHAISDAPVVSDAEIAGTGPTVFVWNGPVGTARIVTSDDSFSTFTTYDRETLRDHEYVAYGENLDVTAPWERTGVVVAVSARGSWSIAVTPDAQ